MNRTEEGKFKLAGDASNDAESRRTESEAMNTSEPETEDLQELGLLQLEYELENAVLVKPGDMLKDVRTYRKLTESAVYHHLCSKNVYAGMEKQNTVKDMLIFNAMLERIGVSAGRFHVLISQEEAEFLDIKRVSVEAVRENDLRSIRGHLDRIRELSTLDSVVAKQWEAYLSYVILVREEGQHLRRIRR